MATANIVKRPAGCVASDKHATSWQRAKRTEQNSALRVANGNLNNNNNNNIRNKQRGKEGNEGTLYNKTGIVAVEKQRVLHYLSVCL